MSVSDQLAAITLRLDNLADTMALSRRQRINARPKAPEVPDPIPIAVPVGMETPPTMAELVQTYVAGAMSKHAAEQGLGTFEEEDDFDEEDPELLPMSAFELTPEIMEDDEPGPEPETPAPDPEPVVDPSPETEVKAPAPPQ